MKFNHAAAPERVTQAHDSFIDYLQEPSFPCVGARSAINRSRYHFELFGPLGTREAADSLGPAIYRFLQAYPNPGVDPVTFIAAFESGGNSEAEFESLLWTQLQHLHDADRERFEWDPAVSSDPASPDFSFSIGGRALFVVGLHPGSSRLARRAPMPTLVFNLHEQFEMLRGNGRYATLQTAIRKRDVALQGSINPVLAQFGEASEALQYSGRERPAGWQCPFKPLVAA